MKRLVWFVPLFVMVCLSLLGLSSVSSSAQTGEIRVRIRLTGAAIGGVVPEGSSEFRWRSATRMSLRVEVNRVHLADGTLLNARVNGVTVGIISLSAGTGSLALNTERGDRVPAIKQGDVVTVVTTAGVTILRGTF